MQPQKSRALIITFIIVLAILILGYFLVMKSGMLKSEVTIFGRTFNPILPTPKKQDIIVDDQNNPTPTPEPTPTPTPEPTPTPNPDPNPKPTPTPTQPPLPKYIPPNLPLPSLPNSANTPNTNPNTNVAFQCEDGVDNDGDKFIDSADNDCHSDGNSKNLLSYVPTYNTELGVTITTTVVAKKSSCDIEDVPLVFTAKEQEELDKLTREFYRIAPQLKSEDDIVSELSSGLGYQDIITNAKDLTKDCRAQTSTAAYLKNNIDQDQTNTTKDLVSWISVLDGRPREDLDSSNGIENPAFKKIDYAVPVTSINISTLNKGRIERLRNPFYDSSKEVYPFKETNSYFMQYYLDPRLGSARSRGYTGVARAVWDWVDLEKLWRVW